LFGTNWDMRSMVAKQRPPRMVGAISPAVGAPFLKTYTHSNCLHFIFCDQIVTKPILFS
jgi:hypothetical protein